MAYRPPRFCHYHAARERGWTNITLDGDSQDPDFPRSRLIDNRTTALFRFTGTPANPNIDIDLGGSFATGLDRIIIPFTHIFDTLKVWQDSDSGFGSADVLHNTDTGVSVFEQIDLEFDAMASTKRYIRLDATGGAANYYAGELFLTKIVTFTSGPNLANSLDSHRDNVTRLEQPTGISVTVAHGPQQRVIEYDYDSPLSGADLVAMELLIAEVGLTRPFYVDPHSFSDTPEIDDPPLLMKFAEMPVGRLAVTVPFSGLLEKTFKLKLIESLE